MPTLFFFGESKAAKKGALSHFVSGHLTGDIHVYIMGALRFHQRYLVPYKSPPDLVLSWDS